MVRVIIFFVFNSLCKVKIPVAVAAFATDVVRLIRIAWTGGDPSGLSGGSNFVSSQRANVAASYKVMLLLAKGGKAFREGELAKACAIKMAEVFGEEKAAEKCKRCLCPTRQWQEAWLI